MRDHFENISEIQADYTTEVLLTRTFAVLFQALPHDCEAGLPFVKATPAFSLDVIVYYMHKFILQNPLLPPLTSIYLLDFTL